MRVTSNNQKYLFTGLNTFSMKNKVKRYTLFAERKTLGQL